MVSREATDSDEAIGNCFCPWGEYLIDPIYITFREGLLLPRGDYVYVCDPEDNAPVIYQISYPFWYRPGFDYEESMISAGWPCMSSRNRYRAIGSLVGKLVNGKVTFPKLPVPPMAEVYRCPLELVNAVTQPQDPWKIRIGENPATGLPVYVAISPLIRQSLLIAGAQGTGKTTALLTFVTRAMAATPPVRFLLLDWTGEFLGLDRLPFVLIKGWGDFIGSCVVENPDVILSLLEEDPRMESQAVSQAIRRAVYECHRDGIMPTRSEVCLRIEKQERKREDTLFEAWSLAYDRLPDSYPNSSERIDRLIEDYLAVVVDFAAPNELSDGFLLKREIAAHLADLIWRRASRDERFGCVIVSDEAHNICPERGRIDRRWLRLATEGGRNGCPLWLVARRLSLVSKSITTESQQNMLCFNVEDIDRRRIEEDLGTRFSEGLKALPQGEAMFKSAGGFRVPGQVVHVRIDEVIKPSSAKLPREKFQQMKRAFP